MAEKIDQMAEGASEPTKISVGHINGFRSLILSFLSLVTLGGFMSVNPSNLQSYFLPTSAFGILVICSSIFAFKPLWDWAYPSSTGDRLLINKETVYHPQEILHSDGKTSSIVMMPRSFGTTIQKSEALKKYVASKVENQNVAIYGMNGSGKTKLLEQLLRLIDPKYRVKYLSFKRKDSGIGQRLGYEKKDMSEFRPDPWSNKTAFKRALLVAIDLEESGGITANSIRPLIEELIDKTNDWDELFVELELSIDNTKESIIQRGALIRIQQAIKAIYDPKARYYDISDINEFLDYSTENETRATFDAEFFLDILYDMIVKEDLKNICIVVDEAHRLLKNKYENGKNVSIIEKMIAREIRATGSRLYICTQLVIDIGPEARDQFSSAFLFKTKDPTTLTELRAISELLDQAVVDLDPYTFVDIGQDYHGVKVRDKVFHFRLNLPEQEEAEIEPTPRQLPEKSREPADIVAPRRAHSQTYLLNILGMLEERAMLTKELATEFAIIENRPANALEDWKPSEEEVRAMKLKLKHSFLQLVSVHDGELASALLLQDEYRDKPQSLYYLKDKGEKRVHTKLVGITKEILVEHNISKIIEGRDRISEPDFEIPGFVIEVETGLRRGNTKDLEERISEAKKSVIIAVPNDDTKKRYKHLVREGKVNILVLYELGYHLDQQNGPVTEAIKRD